MIPVFVGRSLAMMCHPLLAWHRLPPVGRVALAGGYAAVSYVTCLVTFLTLRA